MRDFSALSDAGGGCLDLGESRHSAPSMYHDVQVFRAFFFWRWMQWGIQYAAAGDISCLAEKLGPENPTT